MYKAKVNFTSLSGVPYLAGWQVPDNDVRGCEDLVEEVAEPKAELKSDPEENKILTSNDVKKKVKS